jgi:hypothetical protein
VREPEPRNVLLLVNLGAGHYKRGYHGASLCSLLESRFDPPVGHEPDERHEDIQRVRDALVEERQRDGGRLAAMPFGNSVPAERSQRPVPKRAVHSAPTVSGTKTERRQRCFSGCRP